MKKIFIGVSIIIMALALASCSSSKNIEKSKNDGIQSAEADDKIISEAEKHIDDENNNVQAAEEKNNDGVEKEAPKDGEDDGKSTDVSNIVNGDVNSPSVSISKEEAVELVRKFMSDNGEYVPSIIMVDNEDESQYIIHAYDVIDDGNGTSHTATSGWYYVNKTTGEVVSMF